VGKKVLLGFWVLASAFAFAFNVRSAFLGKEG